MPLTPLDGGTLLPYECHEGNHAIRQSLGAERAEDAAVAADLAKGITRARRRCRTASVLVDNRSARPVRRYYPPAGRGAGPGN